MNYTPTELRDLGITCGANVAVHRSVEFFQPSRITLGDNVRIDCFCVLSAGEPMRIGSQVHLAAGVTLFGASGVEIGDFAGFSSRVAVYSASDDYTDGYLTNPTIPSQFKRVQTGRVVIGPHVIVGAGSVILPALTLARGAAIGALSLVNKDVPEFAIAAGNPIRVVGRRNRERLDALEREFLAWRAQKT